MTWQKGGGGGGGTVVGTDWTRDEAVLLASRALGTQSAA